MEEIARAERLRNEARKRPELSLRSVGGDKDLDLRRAAKLLEKLAAVAAGDGGDGDVGDPPLAACYRVDDEELLGVDRLVQGHARKLKIHPQVDSPADSQSGGADAEIGDRRASESLRGGNEKGEELGDGEPLLGGPFHGIFRRQDEDLALVFRHGSRDRERKVRPPRFRVSLAYRRFGISFAR